MSDEKKSKNPFINMANAAKKANNFPNTTQQQQTKVPKPSKGFGGATTMRKTGRGR
jgi:hypothetical protein